MPLIGGNPYDFVYYILYSLNSSLNAMFLGRDIYSFLKSNFLDAVCIFKNDQLCNFSLGNLTDLL